MTMTSKGLLILSKTCRKQMLPHLERLGTAPNRVVVWDSGLASPIQSLIELFPQAQLIRCDVPGGEAAPGRFPNEHTQQQLVCQPGRWPFAQESIDLVCSGLFLGQLGQMSRQQFFAQVRQALRPSGVFLFGCFSPETQAKSAAEMMTWGDELVEAGFLSPVIEAARVVLVYPTKEMLRADQQWMHISGQQTQTQQAKNLENNLEERQADQGHQVTYEILTGVAWGRRQEQTIQEHAIPLEQIKRL